MMTHNNGDNSTGSSRCCQWRDYISWALVLVGIPHVIFGLVTWELLPGSIANQKKLLSGITDNTPISGFYGPGAWWAFLITLGMSHANRAMTFWRTGELPSDWDWDLLGASVYIVVAAVDLMHKSRMIAQLEDKASESTLLPAMICAERVVSVGTGSSLFVLVPSALVPVLLGRAPSQRNIGVTAIPLIFALVTSGFSFHVHQTISQAPLVWFSLHDQRQMEEKFAPTLTTADVPAFIGYAASPLLGAYYSKDYWTRFAATISGTVITIVFLVSLGRRRGGLRPALRTTACTVLIMAGIFYVLPIFFFFFFAVAVGTVVWVVCWTIAWWFIYILAFFPQVGFFPPTKITVLEMDQMVVLLGILAVAAIRIVRSILKVDGRSSVYRDPLTSFSKS
ncbi:hypothetical protein MVEN_00482700 [Mycena venus]|uniref:Uncharacterized protein n=1 Tax=Mycena venus TaxID=2733690 RepID=A0A8H6YYC2_9AGAR|nr:hypothetical protein MVEN_00482700 [Mycena venus]